MEIGRCDHRHDGNCGHDYNEYRGRRTVGDVVNTMSEEQRSLLYKYIGEITSGYLSDETRKAYAKMAMTELDRDQFRVVAWLEMKAVAERKEGDA